MHLRKGQAGAAVAATVAKARITGNIIDRRAVGEASPYDALTDEELVREATKKARALGIAGLRLVQNDN